MASLEQITQLLDDAKARVADAQAAKFDKDAADGVRNNAQAALDSATIEAAVKASALEAAVAAYRTAIQDAHDAVFSASPDLLPV